MLRQELRERCEQLMLLLADQVQNLPLGNESWMNTERELWQPSALPTGRCLRRPGDAEHNSSHRPQRRSA